MEKEEIRIKRIESSKKWRKNRSPEMVESNRIRGLQWFTDNPEQYLVLTSRGRAKKAKLEHNITKEDIKIPEFCPYLGVKLNVDRVNGAQKHRASLDRIDSSLGYVKDNIEVISWQANTMKSDATREELLCFAIGILNKFKETP